MLRTASFYICCIFILSGCASEDEPMPQIVGTVDTDTIVKPLPTVKPLPSWSAEGSNIPSSWYPPKNVEKGWKAIVIHHSGGGRGNARIFDEWHRNGRHWEGIGYDFVIGNGSNSGDGQIEITFRWTRQIAGAHVGGTPGNWANKDAVGICLVGDFRKTAPTQRQMQSLLKLVRFLQKRYKIPKSKIYGHSTTPGYTGGTVCPGRYFPMARFKAML